MKLIIVHSHLRPGGIRRIIELATPYLVRAGARAVARVVLAIGQRADRPWHEHFAQQLPGVPVEVFVEGSFNYLSEQRASPRRITANIRSALEKLLTGADGRDGLVWAHNLGVGRNLLLARELVAACASREIPLVAHHHDWWFDNRWERWAEMRRFGLRSLTAPAQAVFPEAHHVIHAAINRSDAAVLVRHFGKGALWLPNLTEPAASPPAAAVHSAREWLRSKLTQNSAPVWLLPCRTLRRKNIAEALLLTRWLRPEAWLVVTGPASSAEEQPYFRALEQAAHAQHWRLRLGVLGGSESRKPGVAELLAVSEAALLTSVQEGFGLPCLEAAAAQRPLIARRLPNIAPDLDRFGFRFPQAYDEILVTPDLFHWHSERTRQAKLLCDWRAMMPSLARKLVSLPPVLAAARPSPVPFSRLTLTAQIEVLACPTRVSWEACAPLNPFLEGWRHGAASGRLRVTPWPRTANRWVGGEAYARRFFDALGARSRDFTCSSSPTMVQTDFIKEKLAAVNLYPLLWNTRT